MWKERRRKELMRSFLEGASWEEGESRGWRETGGALNGREERVDIRERTRGNVCVRRWES